MHRSLAVRSLLCTLALFVGLGAIAPAGAAHADTAPAGTGQAGSRPTDPVPALERRAHALDSTEPSDNLRDLRPFGRMVGDARVVGLGEATHSSREFFTLRHRVLRYLVQEKGFRTFALEVSWSTGMRINSYVLHGMGDPRRIMHEEMQYNYRFHNTAEYLRLIEWMRTYNNHATDKVQFVGIDIGYAGTDVFDAVTEHVRHEHPELLDRVETAYQQMRPRPGVDMETHVHEYLGKPLAERRRIAEQARQVLRWVRRQEGASMPERSWAVQHARAIAQTAKLYAFDRPSEFEESMRYRDRAMAANTVWWHRQLGHKMLLASHNNHVTYRNDDPGAVPEPAGAVLRESLGSRYVNVGLSFYRGSFNAFDQRPDGPVGRFHSGPAQEGSNEQTLDQVRHRDYLLDMRTAPGPARRWLATPRPTHNVGLVYPEPQKKIALGESFDILIHLHDVDAADLLR